MKKKIGCLGAGAWGYSLASLLADKGHDVTLWTRNEKLFHELHVERRHPKLPEFAALPNIQMTQNMEEAIHGQDIIVESVTAGGMRSVFEEAKLLGLPKVPIVLTSKGIEQHSGFLMHEVAAEVLGKEYKECLCLLSGPTIAKEVMEKLPASTVCAGYNDEVIDVVVAAFNTKYFRVYPNRDVAGASFGGAMKNIIAIACGASDGLGFGDNSKAALMTRGLHEIRKLSVVKHCDPATIYGLSGMGDLCVTCLSTYSRNYTFGRLVAEGYKPEEAKEKIGMVVEGAYTCVAALELGRKHHIPLPITEAVYRVIYEGVKPKEAVKELLKREVKHEHL